MVLPVVYLRNWVQGGDRAALNNIELVLGEAPFDILWAGKMRLDLSAHLPQPHYLLVRQRLDILPLRFDLPFLRATFLQGVDAQPLGDHLLIDDPAVPHLEEIGIYQAGDERLAKPKAGVDGQHFPVGRDGIGREHDSRSLGENHPLDDAGEDIYGAVGKEEEIPFQQHFFVMLFC